ncbi:SON protein [Anaerovorax sp. IOR16]|uniref:SON protein n=1 Tax=Anaerovorax sp. IOR16 TaxID=2773458 RepID=UPI001FD69215|nr:SON protein [Anaerovorax sp. IOR16]
MIGLCMDYLEGKLKETGIKGKVRTTEKELKLCQDSHVGAVLFEKESFTRSGSKKVYSEGESKKKRTKIFNRQSYFSVTIGEYSIGKCEEIFLKFMESLDRGILDEKGNYIYLEIEGAEWVDEKDSILRSKMAVQILIRFDGGIYKDSVYGNLQEATIENVEEV